MNSQEQIYKILENDFSVSRETLKKLNQYVEELIRWNAKINLISKNTIDDIWQRHILDSVQLQKYIPKENLVILDIGSGAGFPGIILGILTENKVFLVESDSRKCAFLNNIKTN